MSLEQWKVTLFPCRIRFIILNWIYLTFWQSKTNLKQYSYILYWKILWSPGSFKGKRKALPLFVAGEQWLLCSFLRAKILQDEASKRLEATWWNSWQCAEYFEGQWLSWWTAWYHATSGACDWMQRNKRLVDQLCGSNKDKRWIRTEEWRKSESRMWWEEDRGCLSMLCSRGVALVSVTCLFSVNLSITLDRNHWDFCLE